MTDRDLYTYADPDGDDLTVHPGTDRDGRRVLVVATNGNEDGCYLYPELVPGLIAYLSRHVPASGPDVAGKAPQPPRT